MEIDYSRILAEFVAQISYADLDDETIEKTKQCVLDYMGVAIGGSLTSLGKLWFEQYESQANRPEAAVWTPGFPRLSYSHAAAVNAANGHLLDYDDLHNSSIVHPATVTIPTALAVGQQLGSSGEDVIAAIVAGFEVATRLGEAINPSSYWFWHTTAVVGSFSAAAVAGHLFGFDPEAMNQCLGTAGTQASGLWQFLEDGADSKSLHVARANLNGILAADLTQRGFTGARRILEGEKGFIRAVAAEPKWNALIDGFGQPFKVMGNSFKPYACCRHTHAGNYAVRELMVENELAFEDIETITDDTYQTALDITDNPDPKTPYGHKFSLQYTLAAMARYGRLTPDEFDPRATADAGVRQLMHKVTLRAPEYVNSQFLADQDRWIHEVTLVLKDGREFSRRVDYPIGDFNNPLGWTQLAAKFDSLVPDGELRALAAKVQTLETLPDINGLF